MILFFSITFLFLFLSIKYPDFVFWVALTIFLDPGGYIETYITREAIGGIQIWDLQFVLLMLPLISPKINIGYYFKFKDNRWIFIFLLIYMAIYHIFIFGYLMQGGNFSTLLDFLQYERLTIVGFIAIIPAYIFFRRSYPLLVKFAFVSSVVLAVFYLTTLITKMPLVPINSFERGLGTDALRISLVSYGYAYWFIFIAVILLLLRIKLPQKKWIYFIGTTLFVAVILTLTRRSILGVLWALFIIYFLHMKFLNRSIFSPKITKILFATGVAVLAIFIIAPKYVGYSIDMINNVVGSVGTLGEEQQIQDGRLVNDIPEHIARFKQSPYLGYGYDPLWYSNNVEEGGISANDVPLTAALGMFGIVGLLFYLVYYFKIFGILFRTYKILKRAYHKRISILHPLVFTISFILLVNFITSYTIDFMSYFADLIVGVTRVKTMINIGFLLASRDIILQLIAESDYNSAE